MKILLMLFVAMSLMAADETPPGTISVEVIIFSGRRNPAWQLQDTNALEKLRLELKDLPEAFSQEPVRWSTLGFKGFIIRNADTRGLPAQIRVYEGVVKTDHGQAAKYLKDLTYFEQSLIDESKKQALEPAGREAIAKYESDRKA